MMKKGRTLLGAAFGINNGLKFGVVIVVDASLMPPRKATKQD